MMDSILREWEHIYSIFPRCIYPKYNLQVSSFPFEVSVKIDTFVEGKSDSDRLMLISSKYKHIGQYDSKFLEECLLSFEAQVHLSKEFGIFNNETSIRR